VKLPMRNRYHFAHLLPRERADGLKRVELRDETNLRLEHIAHSSQHALCEKNVAQFFVLSRHDAFDCGFRIEVRAKQVARRLRNAAFARKSVRRMDLGDGNVETDRKVFSIFKHDARGARGRLPLLPRAVDVPAAAHQHVRGDSCAAGKMNEQPLAASFHLRDDLPGQWSVIVKPGQQRIRRAKRGYGLAGERAMQRAGRAEDCVAFRHAPIEAPQAEFRFAESASGSAAGAARAAQCGIRHP
jgi:hypothetical protein